ncbi:MAG: hypothetical protein UW88_C0004G0021 [Candidatus Collierbacteria bacterium GW2011_GWD2_45_10]|uniref:Peptidase C39-like domain-containing protein n=1 Tax=Candidatus Collierbacteria bacterium GW2011_GWB2_44_22 TaxID=1618387 RepID=A0A0G1I0B6_9BACT|nr:MAG: hypothetical protein UW31_C0007G0023 [Candidatus Collierbacteria bacterium GW2011_GWA2_44_13]KKT50290.1 MAG: hypothetical protein UW42_C0021G0009 [Candidatus Collierbacteria bacterium GW2011_GWB1_44_197]KKT52253.1 MAG: hypothetical protein UW44_C0003G0096 [Candidatus Collierbacteria bacterium GW2011_GWB2_44_22]KKT63173.1 MAG: hypothetical protein UW56_C0001G0010 [Candidatus Collierbacteria bacterium GW2011_GWD1_44_27]KKT66082.1 MAG: hypothetical protein UW58_C0013G0010 [Candidatus Colli
MKVSWKKRKRNYIFPLVFGVIVTAGLGYATMELGGRNNRLILSDPATPWLPLQVMDINKTSPEPVINIVTPGRKFSLPSAKWVPQTFNNCGPATTSMALQYFGYSVTQEETKRALRTNPKDSNVFTYEIGNYLRNDFNIESRLMFNGNMMILKTLVTNGFYIIIEDWLHPFEDIGHNAIIRGFDDDMGVFIADDPFTGVGVKYKYSDFDEGQWKPFNREYLPVYRKEKESLLKAIVGENWDTTRMHLNAIRINELDVQKNPNDMYAWFNIGTSYYALGQYTKAKEAFERSRTIGWPMRMLWYQYQPVQTYNHLGEYDKALEMAAIGLSTYEAFSELHLELAIAHKGLGNLSKARVEVERAITLAPNFEQAITFQNQL